jgi:hypothetical protein
LEEVKTAKKFYFEIYSPYIKMFTRLQYIKGLFILFVLFTACGTPENPFDKLRWLEGKWISEKEDEAFIEAWTLINDTLITGYGLTVSGNDTVFSEQLRIVFDGRQIQYVAFPSDQTETYFTLTGSADSLFIFENKEHDWPQKITYQLISSDLMKVIVSGMKDGHERSFGINFRRANIL